MHLHTRIKQARQDIEMSQTNLGARLGVSHAAVSSWEKGRSKPSSGKFEKLAEVLGVTVNWLMTGKIDAENEKTRLSPRKKSLQSELDIGSIQFHQFDHENRLPVRGARAGDGGIVVSKRAAIDWVDRPERLKDVADAYALYVLNDSMEPKYRQGDLLLIDPHKPPRTLDYIVIVKEQDDDEMVILVKQLVERDDDGMLVRQFSPRLDFRISTDEIDAVHLVVGNYESR